MQADDPPFLSVGTAVSAKYKGAFCEAKVSKVVHVVKCRVTYKMGLGTAILGDNQLKGTLRVGQLVQAHHPDKKDLVDATITKIQDCSQYTVVFDDGDITTLRRTALCLKSGRHFNESETLDQLPLTHPEHFGNPVVGGRRGRRSRLLKDDSSDGEVEEENEPDLEVYLLDLKRVVRVESTDKKRTRDNWFPGLVVIPSAQPTVRINMKDEYLIRSFSDGRYYTVPKKEASEFNRSMAEKVENSYLAEAIRKALRFLDHNELPLHWEKSDLFNSQAMDSESDRFTDSSDDEPCEEKDRFVAQLYKFMDDAGTPLNKTPTIGGRDIDLHRLFRVVQKLGGYNRVTNQNKWRMVTARLYLPNNQNTFNQVKAVYKKCLSSYETFNRTLGVTMLNHTRPTKKNKGRSLIRDKDRATPGPSPGPIGGGGGLGDESAAEERRPLTPAAAARDPAKARRAEKRRAAQAADASDAYSSDATDHSEAAAREGGRPRRGEPPAAAAEGGRGGRERKGAAEGAVRALVERFEERGRKEEEEKGQLTRSKSQPRPKEPPLAADKDRKPDGRPPNKETKPASAAPRLAKKSGPSASSSEDDKKNSRRRDAGGVEAPATPGIGIGDKLKVYYGPTHESKVTYEAKVIEIDKDATGAVYLVHYTGWNTRYDEWIQPQRVAENLSAATKAKRIKQQPAGASAGVGAAQQKPKPAGKRGRLASGSSAPRVADAPPRSTTPSSVTSSSSRTKSPGTPAATRSAGRVTRQDFRTRRISAQTDASNHTESDSDGSGSESEMSRTRSGTKSDETEVPIRTYQKRAPKPPKLPKTDNDTEKEDDQEKPTKRPRKPKRSPEKSADESDDEDTSNPPKGRDFDLNQIRSELKGFAKAIQPPQVDLVDELDKEAVSSDEPQPQQADKPLEKSSSSEDVYEFKEPEPFEFESRAKLGEEKKRAPARVFEDVGRSPGKRKGEPPDSPERRVFRRATRLGDMSPSNASEVNFSPKSPVKKEEFSEEDEDDDEEEEEAVTLSSPPKEEEDPFDKLVESPCFNIVKSLEKPIENKDKVMRNLHEETLSLFRELPETVEDYSGDMELSDCESQTEIFTTSPEKMAQGEEEACAEAFQKSPSRLDVLDIDFPAIKTDESKEKDNENSDDEDSIREQIQRVIAQSRRSSTDEDSGDVMMLEPPAASYQVKKKDCELIPTMATILGISMLDVPDLKKEEVVKAEEAVKEEEKQPPLPPAAAEPKPAPPLEKFVISPALQETDSSLLESIVSRPPVPLEVKLEETAKELSTIKTGTRIADSILLKLNSIKNEMAAKGSAETDAEDDEEEEEEKVGEVGEEEKEKGEPEDALEPTSEPKKATDTEPPGQPPAPPLPPLPTTEQRDARAAEEVEGEDEEEGQVPLPAVEEAERKRPLSPSTAIDRKRRRKVGGSRAAEESDSGDDSSDSEQLVIARSDDDSRSESAGKVQRDIAKESDSSNMFHHSQTTDDSQSQEERNFNFDRVDDSAAHAPPPPLTEEEDAGPAREEETDPQLHSMLLCEEEIPRSPAEPHGGGGAVVGGPRPEMPFASAPGTGAGKSMLLEAPPQGAGTPPSSPASSVSNLSPRGDTGGLSPTPADNESCRSNDVEPEYPRQRRGSSAKVTPYSEEDTQMVNETPAKRLKEPAAVPASCSKRRKSQRSSDDSTKKSKKVASRSRQNSDSDDTSDHSNTNSAKVASSYNRANRSPRPSKYNFFVDFDPSWDSGQRIAAVQQKISELRKTYVDVKAELAVVERRRKKIRRREREAMKAAKQETGCA